jgi:nitrous oxide reductase accessory protein NosL
MSQTSRVAFAKADKAASFQKRKGGRTATFQEAMADTFCGMWTDLMKVREMRLGLKKYK